MLSVSCGHCGQGLRVPERLAGKKARCPRCSRTFAVPPLTMNPATTPTVEVSLEEAGRWPAIPGYAVLGELGRGGMGVVYKARQEALGRVVALKTVRLDQQSGNTLLARFEKEARAVAQLRHPNIVVAFDFGRHEGLLYFAMELLEGEDLAARLDRVGPLDEATAWGLARQAAAGLAHAHERGLVHRDIKPSNLFLVEPPEGFPLPAGLPLVKVTDFGLVLAAQDTAVTDRLTAHTTLLGTPQYMAPEQFRGSDVDHRADVYGLGAAVHHMLAGRAPFGGRTVWEVMAEKTSRAAPPPPAQVSAATARLLADMMASDRDRRPRDYRELIGRIDALATDRASPPRPAEVPKPPPTPPRKPGRFWLTAAGLAIVVGLIAGAAAVFLRPWVQAAPQPTLVVGSRSQDLFDGAALTGWQVIDGQWAAARDEEGGRVLAGLGGVRRALPDYANYRLVLGVDPRKAASVEIQFGFSAASPVAPRHVLRLTASEVVLGRRPGDRGPLEVLSPALPVGQIKGQSPYQELRVERQGETWWASFNGTPVGTVPAVPRSEPPLVQLLAEGDGPALFADIHVSELVPPTP